MDSLGLSSLGRGWVITLQISSAVAGAALGNFLRLDMSDQVVRNQARPAMRHLSDQIGRLQRLVIQVERHGAQLSEDGGSVIPSVRTADWFDSIGQSLRNEIAASASAIEDWNDLAPSILDQEKQKFDHRDQRLPTQSGAGSE